jgi:hypothetical protein
MVAIAVLGITPKGWVERRLSGAIAILALLFFVSRIAVTTWTFADLDRAWQGQLAALDHVPPGSRVLVQAWVPCSPNLADEPDGACRQPCHRAARRLHQRSMGHARGAAHPGEL